MFIFGAKYQASKMYSEEDLIEFGEFINDRLPDLYSRFDTEEEFKEFLKQSKK